MTHFDHDGRSSLACRELEIMCEASVSLLEAMKILSENAFWRSLLAENIGIGGIERLVQDSILWAINAASGSPFLASTDKKVPIIATSLGDSDNRLKCIDVVLYNRTPGASEEWWSIWNSPMDEETRANEFSKRCCGYVEIKSANPEGFLSGTARFAADQVDNDVRCLRAASARSIELEHPSKDILILLLVMACYPLAGDPATAAHVDGEKQVKECEEAFWQATKTLESAAKIGEHWLVRGEPYPSDPRRSTFLKGIVINAGDRKTN